MRSEDKYKTSRLLYIIEAALEYFISIAVGTIYLAKITSYIGISDAVTGILTSFVSLGCSFQIVAIFLNKYKPVKIWVTFLHTISQIMFALLYMIPLFKMSKAAKIVIFITMLLLAHIIHNIVNAPKINWFMLLVDDNKRGKFTADKEMVSLVGGMAVSFLLGMLIDYYTEINQLETAFILCGIGLFFLMILHSLTLIFSKEKVSVIVEKRSSIQQLKDILKNKDILKIVLVAMLWNIASHSTMPFMGTYQINELGFSASFASAIIIVGSLTRVICSKPLGMFADKKSFSNMLCICFAVEILAFTMGAFAAPSNGKIVYFIFYKNYLD